MLPFSLLHLSLLGCPSPGTDGPGKPDGTDGTPVDTATPTDPTTSSGADDAAAEALEALRGVSEQPVQLSPRRGIPSAVSMAVPIGDGDAVEEAYAFFETYAPLYGLTDVRAQMHPRSARTDEYGTHVRFAQRSLPEQGGLPLFNSGLTMHVAEGRVYLTSGRYVPDLVARPPALTADEAFAAVQTEPALYDVQVQGTPVLGLYAAWSDDDTQRPTVHTVWRASITGKIVGTTEPVFWRLDVDAVTGALVHTGELTATCDKDFDIMYGYHGMSDSCWVFASTDDWFDADGALSDYSPDLDHNTDGIEAFTFAEAVYAYHDLYFGQCSYDYDDAEVEMVTHVGDNWTNASAIGVCGTLQFGDDYTTLDIIAHEFNHLVDYNANDLEYEGQSGALDESFADVLACFVDGNWTIGEDLPVGAIRDLSDPPSILNPNTGNPSQPDHMLAAFSGDGMGLRDTSNPTDNGFVHINSGIPNKAAYLITAGGTHNGYTIDGIGPFRAQQLYHAVHIWGLEDDADFVDARHMLVFTALSWATLGWHGFDLDDHCQVANAFASVGVDPLNGDSDCDGVVDGWDGDDDGDGTPDGTDNCPFTSNLAQSDTDGDGTGDACDDDDDDDGVLDPDDNCALVANLAQTDADGDGRGDPCDDGDGDGWLDINDNCPSVHNWNQADTDGDGTGNACDTDADGDGALDAADNCPFTSNPDQSDTDGDEQGDICDNCPDVPNPDQEDCDGDGMGHACDNDLVEINGCIDLVEAAMQVFVNPLDEVILPHVTEVGETRLSDDFRLQLTVSGTTEPWMITDQWGNVVVRGEAPSRTAPSAAVTWTPALDYHYVEADGTRADFATTYAFVVSPDADAQDVDLLLEGAYAAP
jgi:hypothetical protein